MTTDQIEAEAASAIDLQAVRGGLMPNSYEVTRLIIKSDIEKAYHEGYKKGWRVKVLETPQLL